MSGCYVMKKFLELLVIIIIYHNYIDIGIEERHGRRKTCKDKKRVEKELEGRKRKSMKKRWSEGFCSSTPSI